MTLRLNGFRVYAFMVSMNSSTCYEGTVVSMETGYYQSITSKSREEKKKKNKEKKEETDLSYK